MTLEKNLGRLPFRSGPRRRKLFDEARHGAGLAAARKLVATENQRQGAVAGQETLGCSTVTLQVVVPLRLCAFQVVGMEEPARARRSTATRHARSWKMRCTLPTWRPVRLAISATDVPRMRSRTISWCAAGHSASIRSKSSWACTCSLGLGSRESGSFSRDSSPSGALARLRSDDGGDGQ